MTSGIAAGSSAATSVRWQDVTGFPNIAMEKSRIEPMCRRMVVLLVLLSLLCVSTPARAERHALAPPLTQVAIRINVMGLLPVDGGFDRFNGWADLDPARPGTCRVQLRIETASLSTSSETVRDEAIGPGFLDSPRFPVIGFDGGCEGDAIVGRLDMHGVTRPFTLAVSRSAAVGVATGDLSRSDWGMNERCWVVGETIRITVTTPLLAAAPNVSKR